MLTLICCESCLAAASQFAARHVGVNREGCTDRQGIVIVIDKHATTHAPAASQDSDDGQHRGACDNSFPNVF